MTTMPAPADPAATDGNPGLIVSTAVDRSLEIAASWLGWDGRPVHRDENVWTPYKALRRITDHLLDHLAEVEALLAGAPTIPDRWHGRAITLDSDWARFTEPDLDEARSRLTRLGQLYLFRYAAAGPAAWDAPRGDAWTLRTIAEHVSEVVWYAEQMGSLGATE
ncbi:MAG TPA: hypothetical protein VKG85_08260 [Actinomycetes bacterium]|nr:hypothetical protein [Actinomycetes bacterium]